MRMHNDEIGNSPDDQQKITMNCKFTCIFTTVIEISSILDCSACYITHIQVPPKSIKPTPHPPELCAGKAPAEKSKNWGLMYVQIQRYRHAISSW